MSERILGWLVQGDKMILKIESEKREFLTKGGGGPTGPGCEIYITRVYTFHKGKNNEKQAEYDREDIK